jgi:hypothetical protein
MKHSYEPAAIGTLNRMRPSVGPSRRGVTFQVENMDDTVPNRLPLEGLMHRHGLYKTGGATVETFDSILRAASASVPITGQSLVPLGFVVL